MDAPFFSSLKAVLGPTNTGKTWYAIDRMLAHRTGMIGLPLRLLAREVYQRIVDRIGPQSVALITGEERLVPPKARYWVATVEAMPDIKVECLAVDEIQTAISFDRGHVFTNRLLHARGTVETLLLGAATMVPVIRALLPDAEIIHRPRLSELSYAGSKKLSRQPARSAIVAFSASHVYAIAELIRRERGGAAVVMGALSPRTRNAQVALYQNGDVDFLVATDAIGMGLNLDVQHVAFADDHKFDGHQTRPLTPAEFGQIAGRAGRHLANGTFGVTAGAESFDEEMVQRLESHDFEPIRVLQWRNPELDLNSLDALHESLEKTSGIRALTRVPIAPDQRALEFLARNEAGKLAHSREMVALLWACCQIPDYRNISPAHHGEIITRIFTDLATSGNVDADWIAEQVSFCNNTEGDIDTLSNRIRQIRTWTFVANRRNWLEDPTHWREKTRDIEDRLSDVLHDKLTQRFVDRRTSVLIRHLRDRLMALPEINERGEVSLEGHLIGSIHGFRFTLARNETEGDAKGLLGAASQVIAPEIHHRAERLAGAPNEELILSTDGYLRWKGEIIASLVEGDTIFAPRLLLLADEGLTGIDRDRVQERVNLWLRHAINTQLSQVCALAAPADLEGTARGIAFQLSENLGILPRTAVSEEVKGLDQEVRALMRKHGIKFGAYHIYLPLSLKPAPRELALLLFALKNGGINQPGVADLPQIVLSGRTSFIIDPEVDPRLYEVAGFKVAGKRAVRVDILERLADITRPLIAFDPKRAQGEPPVGAAEGNGFTVTVEMTSLLGCSGEDFASILTSLGYRLRRTPKPVAPKIAAVPADDAASTPVADAAPVSTSTPDAPPVPANDDFIGAEDLANLAALDGVSPDEIAAAAQETAGLDAEELASAARLDGTASQAPSTPADADATAPPTEGPPEPAFDEVWFPGGRRHNTHHEARHSSRHRTVPAEGGEENGTGQNRRARTNQRPRPEGDRPGHRKPKNSSPGKAEENRPANARTRKPPSDRPENKRQSGGKSFDKPGSNSRRPAYDPDSPFAALAALRDRKPE